MTPQETLCMPTGGDFSDAQWERIELRQKLLTFCGAAHHKELDILRCEALMKRDGEPWTDNFIRELIQQGRGVLVRSTCCDCGKSAAADTISDKILLWEQFHICVNAGRRSNASSNDASHQDL